ncbi:hypothetical protein M9H77_29787 [Catharanthus roseus]|uniref:Uncharacterized protein n=1 Tax=Catharanthus roseus TaxID=4058 RepID=A0ACB9ZVG0_CATRO|nr:hypothetical protein M9H77_29787 [Catharanthus roseus]
MTSYSSVYLPEAQIEEAATFYSYYFEPHVSTKAKDPPRNDEGDQLEVRESGLSICNGQGRAYSKSTTRYLDDKEYKAAMNYILLNYDEVEAYIMFHTQERGSGGLTYKSSVRVKESDWWAVIKSRPRMLNVLLVDVPFQELVDIAETSRIDVDIQDIGTLISRVGRIIIGRYSREE